MLPLRIATIGCVAIALGGVPGQPARSSAPGSLSSHHEIVQLKTVVREHLNADRRDAATATVRRMAALDPEHPSVYLQAVLLFRAEDAYDEAREWLPTLGSTGPGRTYGAGVVALYEAGYEEAELAFREACSEYRRMGHVAGQAICETSLGDVLRRRRGSERYAEAAERFADARNLYIELDDRLGVARVDHHRGKLARSLRDDDAALSLFRDALSVREELNDRRGQGTSWFEIGKSLRALRRPGEAVDALERSLDLRNALGDELAQFSVLRELAQVHLTLGRPEEADRCWTEAGALAAAAGSETRVAWTQLSRGDQRLNRADHDGAVKLLRLAVETSRRAADPATEARASRSLGVALARLGRFSAASDALRAANELGRTIESPRLRRTVRASALTELAVICVSSGELTQALLYQQEALELWPKRPRNGKDRFKALNNLGLIYRRLGDLEAAQRYLEDAAALAEVVGSVELNARAQNNLGVALADAGRASDAIESIRAAIGFWQTTKDDRGIALSRYNAAGILWTMDEGDEARRLLEQALSGFRRAADFEGEAYALTRSGQFLLESTQYEAAQKAFAEAIVIAADFGFRWTLAEARAGMATVHESTGNTRLALAEYDRSIREIESMRSQLDTGEFKMKFFSTTAALYERALILRAKNGGPDGAEAFGLAEQARARSLLDLLIEARARPSLGLPVELSVRESELVDAVTAAAVALSRTKDGGARPAARRELEIAEEKLRRFQLELRRKAPKYSEVVHASPSTLAGIQRNVLAEDETLLRYFIGDDHALVWVVERDRARWFELPSPGEIADRVARYVDEISRPRLSIGGRTASGDSGQLAELLRISGVPSGRRLLIVPDGPLHHLPFETLKTGGRYLIEDHPVTITPSATALELMRGFPRRTAPGGFLGLGDPAIPAGDVGSPPLRHSGEALDRIAALFPQTGSLVLKGPAYTRNAILAESLERFRYVHFATHGWLDADHPRYFGLRLSPASPGGEADYLYLDDVFGMQLDADLVVLSACRSGLGETLRGEGLVGMTRAFLYAGARSLVVSLWNIDDRSTAEFMEAFYRELESADPAAALRRVKLRFLASARPAQRQPYRWAPFVLVGGTAAAAPTTAHAIGG